MSTFIDKIVKYKGTISFKMPPVSSLRKSLKSVCVDTVLFFALFALVGHLTINFWERYTIQSELSNMKHSLHTLKDTITNIGKAYDNLHSELKDLFYMVDKKQLDNPQCKQKREFEDTCKAENKFAKRLHDIQVQTVLTKINKKKIGIGIGTKNNKHSVSNTHEHKAAGPFVVHATTNTRNPPKSIGTTTDRSNYEKELSTQHSHKRVHSYYNCPRCYNNLSHYLHVCKHAKKL